MDLLSMNISQMKNLLKRYLVTFSTKIQATGTLYTVHIEFLKCTRSGR